MKGGLDFYPPNAERGFQIVVLAAAKRSGEGGRSESSWPTTPTLPAAENLSRLEERAR